MKQDLNFIAAMEKAVREKYGEEAIANPKGNWTPDKEEKYLQEVKEARKKEFAVESSQEKVELDGVLISKKLINKTMNRKCSLCNNYSFNRNDDMFLNKHSCCFRCYIDRIEGR